MRPATRSPAWGDFGIVCLVMSMVVYRFSRTVADPDLWGHIKFGQTVWEAGRVALPDPFSYVTAGRLWVNHEWLAEVIWYLVFTALGSTGLIVLKLGVATSVFGLVYRHLCRRGMTALGGGCLVLALMPCFVVGLLTVRPVIVSYLLTLIVLLLVHRMSYGGTRWMWVAPPLFVLWVNLHPSFLAGLAILVLWAVTELVTRRLASPSIEPSRRPSSRAIVLLVVASGLATAVNPYGVYLWRFLYHTATVPRPDIGEWQPLALMSLEGMGYALFLGLGAWGLWGSRREPRPALIAVLGVVALLPLVAVRHTPIAALGIIVLTGEHIGDAWARLSDRLRRAPASESPSAWLRGGAAAVAVILTALSVPNFAGIPIEPSLGLGYPVRAAGLIRDSGVRANMAVDFAWGLYAIYQLGPAVKVSVDGRRETMYRQDVYLENLQFQFGEGDWDALLRNHDTELALVRTGFPASNLMRLKPGWRLVYADPTAELYARDGVAALTALGITRPRRLPHDGRGWYFP